MSVVLAMLAVTATCVPSDNPKLTKLETASAFFDAFNKGDHAAMGALIKPGALMVMAPGDSLELAGLLSNIPAGARLEVKEMTFDDAGNVVVRTHSSDGTDATGMIKLEGGCIVELAHQQQY
jgi:hypothetical protein